MNKLTLAASVGYAYVYHYGETEHHVAERAQVIAAYLEFSDPDKPGNVGWNIEVLDSESMRETARHLLGLADELDEAVRAFDREGGARRIWDRIPAAGDEWLLTVGPPGLGVGRR